jgi:hypothetical protein
VPLARSLSVSDTTSHDVGGPGARATTKRVLTHAWAAHLLVANFGTETASFAYARSDGSSACSGSCNRRDVRLSANSLIDSTALALNLWRRSLGVGCEASSAAQAVG